MITDDMKSQGYTSLHGYLLAPHGNGVEGCGSSLHAGGCHVGMGNCTCAHCDECGALYAPFNLQHGLCGVCFVASLDEEG